MSRIKKQELVQVGPLVVKVFRNQFQDGTCQVLLNCNARACPRKCGISFRTESDLWRVSVEEHAKRLSTLCGELAKLALETRKQNGLKNPI